MDVRELCRKFTSCTAVQGEILAHIAVCFSFVADLTHAQVTLYAPVKGNEPVRIAQDEPPQGPKVLTAARPPRDCIGVADLQERVHLFDGDGEGVLCNSAPLPVSNDAVSRFTAEFPRGLTIWRVVNRRHEMPADDLAPNVVRHGYSVGTRPFRSVIRAEAFSARASSVSSPTISFLSASEVFGSSSVLKGRRYERPKYSEDRT